jgi:hypothetical protein
MDPTRAQVAHNKHCMWTSIRISLLRCSCGHLSAELVQPKTIEVGRIEHAQKKRDHKSRGKFSGTYLPIIEDMYSELYKTFPPLKFISRKPSLSSPSICPKMLEVLANSACS